jgi:hypothetical protein
VSFGVVVGVLIVVVASTCSVVLLVSIRIGTGSTGGGAETGVSVIFGGVFVVEMGSLRPIMAAMTAPAQNIVISTAKTTCFDRIHIL